MAHRAPAGALTMPSEPTRPSWPFGRWIRVPKPPPTQREQCPGCMGGGEVNGCECPSGCDGRGWFDADHPKPRE